MKRIVLALFILAVAGSAIAQTTIDKPAATVKLSRQEVVSVRQLKADVERLQKTTGMTFTLEQTKQVLEARINSMLFLQFCEREKITIADTEVANVISQMKSSIGPKATDADLENQLRATGVFVEAKVYIKQRLLFEKYVQTKRANDLKAGLVPPNADDILNAYDLAKASLLRPDTMKVSILFVDTRGKSEADAKKGKETLQAIAAALKLNPGKFDEYLIRSGDSAGYKAILALSMEKTPQNKTIFGDSLFDTVFKLKEGEVSGMIESPTGYRIVRANEFLPQKQLGLADSVPGNPNMSIQQFLSYQIASDREEKLLDKLEGDLITKLREEAVIKIFEENIK